MDKNKSNWTVVIILLIVFWPLGLYMWIKQFNENPLVPLEKMKAVKIAAISLIAFGVLGFIVYVSDQSLDTASGVGISLFFMAGGGLLFFQDRRMQGQRIKFSRYKALVEMQKITEIDLLSVEMRVSHQEVISDLRAMLDRRILIDAYIDEKKDKIISIASDTKSQERIVICKSCGAESVITSSGVYKCSYCHQHIH